MASRNRALELLKAGATLNGIDYVEVRQSEPTHVYVHFFNGVAVAGAEVTATITGGDRVPEVEVAAIEAGDWSEDPEGRVVLRLTVPGRVAFSPYAGSPQGGQAFDPYFRSVGFSFYAFCPSNVDCRGEGPECAEDDVPAPAIDYLAKDFDSFKRALSDYSVQRYPEWQERAEADFGVMMMELLSAVGDELSHVQDAIALEGTLETARERKSLVRLARLVDYEPSPVMCARTILQLDVTGSTVPSGVRVTAMAADGSEVPFEVGTGVRDTGQYAVSPLWNAAIEPYWWDDDDRCLAPGTRSMHVEGAGLGFFEGQVLLIDTEGATTADPAIRQLVMLTEIEEMEDPLFGLMVTRIGWRKEDALRHHHDLTRTQLAGNLVPATQGLRRTEHFVVGEGAAVDPSMARALARLGANSLAEKPRWQHLHSLSQAPLGYLPNEAGKAEPEIVVTRTGDDPREWAWVRTMLEAGAFEEKFTLEAGSYRKVMDLPDGVATDYDGSEGTTIKFGDGTFGELPNDDDVFEVKYRESRGGAGNVPADSITGVDPAWAGIVLAARNPFAAEGGAEAETDEQVRRRAPEAFRTVAYRAVREEDYNAAAMRHLDWVQRAGTVFRWTGSWPTVFTTADPAGAGAIAVDEHVELIGVLNRYRLAGYEAYAPRPRYVSFDLRIRVCARAEAFRGDVQAGVERALRPERRLDGSVGFFHFDNFTLGTAFERSQLEAAIQAVPGVAGVLSIEYRRRGHLNNYVTLPSMVKFAPGEIFRVDNDANYPERGSYRVKVEGGK